MSPSLGSRTFVAHRQDRLIGALSAGGLQDQLIEKVLDSGYMIRDWVGTPSHPRISTVSDMMYGVKGLSSRFPVDKFVDYVKGNFRFPRLPSFKRFKVRTRAEIEAILSVPHLREYAADGTLSFRGQPNEYKFKRQVPNPLRSDASGFEISVMAGIYRQATPIYSFKIETHERPSIEPFVHELEPRGEGDASFSFDLMRTEQHYATQTAGLDLAFDIETAIFFATHRFKGEKLACAHHEVIKKGEHAGLIYCFRFIEPKIPKTKYLIQNFDFFRTYPPERILRQQCGLPVFSDFERNLAITDIDCIIELDPEFESTSKLTPEYMFPGVREDAFYGKLLELKDRHPEELANIVEYKWARTG